MFDFIPLIPLTIDSLNSTYLEFLQDAGIDAPKKSKTSNSFSKTNTSLNVTTSQQSPDSSPSISSNIPSARKKRKKLVNTCVYCENVPAELSDEDLKQFMEKAGIIFVDKITGIPKIKRYNDGTEAMVAYLSEESVEQAIKLLDGHPFPSSDPNQSYQPLIVKKAEFTGKKKKRRKKKALYSQEEAKSWAENARELIGPTSIVLENLFDPVKALVHEDFYINLEKVLEQVNQVFGTVQKVWVYQDHSQGIASIRFSNHEHAKAAISYWNGTNFKGRKIKAYFWDGETNYRHVGISEQARRLRDELFGSWIESQTNPDLVKVVNTSDNSDNDQEEKATLG